MINQINLTPYPIGNMQTVYTAEGKTALELAGITAKKVNECIDIVNGVDALATQATQTVEDMRNVQDTFVTESNAVIQQMTDLQLSTQETIESQYNAFVSDINTQKDAFISSTNASKALLESDYTNAKNAFIANSNSSYELFVADINATKVAFTTSAEQTITDFETDKNALLTQLETIDVPNQVNTKINALISDGTISDTIDAQIFAGINEQLSSNNSRIIRTNQLSNTLGKLINKQAVKIVCNGDSWTIGHLGGGVNSANPYPLVLQGALRERYEYANINVINNGVSGRRSDQAIGTFDADTLSLNPDLVILMYGINEAREIMTIADYKANMNTLINMCLTANVEVLVLTPGPTIEDNKGIELQIFNNACIEIAKQNNVAYIDMHNEFNKLFITRTEDKGLFYGTDKIHLKDGKYAYISDAILSNYLFTKISPAFINGSNFLPIVASPFIATNCIKTFETELQRSKISYYMSSSEIDGNYLTFDFYICEDGLDFYLVDITNANVGAIECNLDGEITSLVGTAGSLVYDHMQLIKSNISKGRHTVSFYASTITPELYNLTNVLFHFSAFEFVQNPVLLDIVPGVEIVTNEKKNGKQIYMKYFTATASNAQNAIAGFSTSGITECWIDNGLSYWLDGTIRYGSNVSTSAGALSMYTIGNAPYYNNGSTNSVVYHLYVRYTK